MTSSSESLTISSTLLMGARSANPNAWVIIVTRYSPKIMTWMLLAGVDSSDAPDLLQDVWRSVLVSLKNFRREKPDDTFRGWLRTITQRRIADYFESRSQQPRHIPLAQLESIQSQSQKLLTDEITANVSERVKLLQKSMQQVESEVKPTTWLVFQMHVIEEKSVEDVAAILKIPTYSVYTSKSRVIKRLRELLEDNQSGKL
jgi:RNA polymerase sigma-70 factor (ECF subfamily)